MEPLLWFISMIEMYPPKFQVYIEIKVSCVNSIAIVDKGQSLLQLVKLGLENKTGIEELIYVSLA